MKPLPVLVCLIYLAALCATLAPAPASAETPAGVAGLWRWKTVVTEGPGKLRGVSGRYTAIITSQGAKTTLAVAKEGFGKTEYAPGAVPVGVATEVSFVAAGQDEGDEQQHEAGSVLNATVRLQGGKTDQRMEFYLRFVGDTVSGYWRYVPGNTTWGAVVGTRVPGQTVSLTLATPLPCVTCCDVLYHCGEEGPGACNSSNQCRDACVEESKPPRACLEEEQ